MCDGLGPDYLDASDMPTLARWRRRSGISKIVRGGMPAVTNIGQLAVFGDMDTVFGELDGEETRALPPAYRSHGSLHETETPLVIHNAEAAPPAGYFTHNHDLVRWLYRG